MWIPDNVVRRRDMAGQLLHDVAGLAVPHMHNAVLWDSDRTRVAHGSGPPPVAFFLFICDRLHTSDPETTSDL